MKTKAPVYCPLKDVGTARQEYWRKKWKNGIENRGPHLGWSRTREFMYKLRKNMMPKKGKV